jgi:hypothetical protein
MIIHAHCLPIVIGWVIVRVHEGRDNQGLVLGIIGCYAFNARVITIKLGLIVDR